MVRNEVTRAAILLSGGMDSYALAYEQRPDLAITFDYGQKAAHAEIQASSVLANRLNLVHEIVQVNLATLGSGDMSDNPKIDVAPTTDWWPYRNQILVTLAAMKVVGFGINELLIATVRSDSSHSDGSEEFIDLMDSVLQLQEGHLRLRAPAIGLSTPDLVRRSKIPYSLLAWSHSCHTSNIACGACRGCTKQREVMVELGLAET